MLIVTGSHIRHLRRDHPALGAARQNGIFRFAACMPFPLARWFFWSGGAVFASNPRLFPLTGKSALNSMP
jgi:hypothetical protein